ncbi:hypothetical protein [Clostridium thermarum]|nr:hypothetical protein [Clostridium thermarum]
MKGMELKLLIPISKPDSQYNTDKQIFKGLKFKNLSAQYIKVQNC